jgi:hypothetical protein
MLPGISAKSASYLGWLRIPLEPIDLPRLSDRLSVHGVLKPFDHGLEVPKAFLQVLETLLYRRVPPAGIRRGALHEVVTLPSGRAHAILELGPKEHRAVA